MGKIVKIEELIGTDVRSRSNAVTFVSRSFADELCNILDKFKNVELENMDHIVQSMIDAVKSGRTKKRIRSEDNSEIKVFDNIDSLSSFLSTL